MYVRHIPSLHFCEESMYNGAKIITFTKHDTTVIYDSRTVRINSTAHQKIVLYGV